MLFFLLLYFVWLISLYDYLLFLSVKLNGGRMTMGNIVIVLFTSPNISKFTKAKSTAKSVILGMEMWADWEFIEGNVREKPCAVMICSNGDHGIKLFVKDLGFEGENPATLERWEFFGMEWGYEYGEENLVLTHMNLDLSLKL
jgi:hypothetical protein